MRNIGVAYRRPRTAAYWRAFHCAVIPLLAGSRLSVRSRPGCRRPEGAVGHAVSYHESPCVETVGIMHAHIPNLTGSAARPSILCIRIAGLVFRDYRLWRGSQRALPGGYMDWYCAYLGTYTVNYERGRWATHLSGGNIPAYLGTDQSRAFKLNGNTLTISEAYTADGRHVRAERVLRRETQGR